MTLLVEAVQLAFHHAAPPPSAACDHGRCNQLRAQSAFAACAELPGSELIAAAAREFAGHVLCSWGFWVLLDPAVRVVSELATNALLHGGVRGMTVARIYRDNCGLWFEIDDHSVTAPQIRLPGAVIDGKADGWGLFLVDCLTDQFGWREADGGKTVFARWVLPPDQAHPDQGSAERAASAARAAAAVGS